MMNDIKKGVDMMVSDNKFVVFSLTENEQLLLNDYRQLSDINKGRLQGRLETLYNQESKCRRLSAYSIEIDKIRTVQKIPLSTDEIEMLTLFRSISSDSQFNAVNKLKQLLTKEHTAKIIDIKI